MHNLLQLPLMNWDTFIMCECVMEYIQLQSRLLHCAFSQLKKDWSTGQHSFILRSSQKQHARQRLSTCGPSTCFVGPAYIFKIPYHSAWCKLSPDIRKHVLLISPAFSNTYIVAQPLSSIKNVKSRTKTHHTDKHLEGCMWIATR